MSCDKVLKAKATLTKLPLEKLKKSGGICVVPDGIETGGRILDHAFDNVDGVVNGLGAAG